jgi:hypothetical protein
VMDFMVLDLLCFCSIANLTLCLDVYVTRFNGGFCHLPFKASAFGQ